MIYWDIFWVFSIIAFIVILAVGIIRPQVLGNSFGNTFLGEIFKELDQVYSEVKEQPEASFEDITEVGVIPFMGIFAIAIILIASLALLLGLVWPLSILSFFIYLIIYYIFNKKKKK